MMTICRVAVLLCFVQIQSIMGAFLQKDASFRSKPANNWGISSQLSMKNRKHAIYWNMKPTASATRLHFFGRGGNDADDESKRSKDDDKVEVNTEPEEESNARRPLFDIFKKKEEKTASSSAAETTSTTSAIDTATADTEKIREETEVPKEPDVKTSLKAEDDTPEQKAAALKAQAEKARLEAERLDAELTLAKIGRLEKEIASAKKKRDSLKTSDDSIVEDLQREMDLLQAKIRGEAPPAPIKPAAPQPEVAAEPVPSSSSSSSSSRNTLTTLRSDDITFSLTSNMKGIDSKKESDILEDIESSPGFIKKMLALSVGMDFSGNATDIDSAELASRLYKMKQLDFSYSDKPKPSFTQNDIDAKIAELKRNPDDILVELPDDFNDTQKAIAALELEYYMGADDAFIGNEEEAIAKLLEGEEWLGGLVDGLNKTAVDAAIEASYPKCTRKEGMEPTAEQVDKLFTDILPKANFAPSSRPEKVAGGYIIRGKPSKSDTDGNALIDGIDEQLAKSSLKDKLTVCYAGDFTFLANFDMDRIGDIADFANMGDIDEQDPILYVLGPDICRERKRGTLSAVTAAGIATSWYLSIYPFLLNTGISSKVEEQLALADSGMTPNLTFLTELSLPLFVTFISLQLVHEAGHRIAAAINGFDITFPTFVPSIITGMTSAVTTFKTPPKNRDGMFDFAVAGPLIGLICSCAAIAVGAQLTLTAAQADLPALPLNILRQSTLGGAIIDGVLGNVLYVPPGALGTPEVASMTVGLHPVAVAGYISLVINALSLLPVGTTDGGRIGLALFGRESKLTIGSITVFGLLIAGVFGSDLLLFYSAFCIAFQSGNEIPARNEVDNLSFSRVIIATLAYVLCFLSLIPFQNS